MKFFADIHQKLLNWRVNREIFRKIFPHLRKDANHGYPFHSNDEMVRLHIRNNLQAGLNLRRIADVAAKMPKGYGDAKAQAEERLIKQIMADTNMTLN
jgi:hypothetical protein